MACNSDFEFRSLRVFSAAAFDRKSRRSYHNYLRPLRSFTLNSCTWRPTDLPNLKGWATSDTPSIYHVTGCHLQSDHLSDILSWSHAYDLIRVLYCSPSAHWVAFSMTAGSAAASKRPSVPFNHYKHRIKIRSFLTWLSFLVPLDFEHKLIHYQWRCSGYSGLTIILFLASQFPHYRRCFLCWRNLSHLHLDSLFSSNSPYRVMLWLRSVR